MTAEEEKLRYLTEHEFFQDFNRMEMWNIQRQATMFTCEPGRLFYQPGDVGEVLFILKEGSVHLYRLTPEGRKLIVATLHKGAIFGEMSLIGQGMHHTFAESASRARICVMSRVDVENLLRRKPELAIRLMRMIAERLRTAEQHLEQLAYSSIPSRLATQLLTLASDSSEVHGFTHQELAEMVGTYRETATAILNDFKNQGLIEIER
ncbi:MAG: Crp/Fnr family transcriptional regulator, partial [Ardenticatenaceae bacterium]